MNNNAKTYEVNVNGRVEYLTKKEILTHYEEGLLKPFGWVGHVYNAGSYGFEVLSENSEHIVLLDTTTHKVYVTKLIFTKNDVKFKVDGEYYSIDNQSQRYDSVQKDNVRKAVSRITNTQAKITNTYNQNSLYDVDFYDKITHKIVITGTYDEDEDVLVVGGSVQSLLNKLKKSKILIIEENDDEIIIRRKEVDAV